ncbi:MAG: 5'-methylthioadenosine/S-adenosylhomocysteine nucleosidase [Chloroflexi bacterium]|nr:MAG: 5'-methylthioadenosine/S-adenosylhomocysteine nucleosidase [Chloroflexota bacterium]
MTDVRPVAVIAALAQEAHALVRRMPRAESVGPRLSVWETDGLVVMVSGVGKVAAAMAAQYTCDVFKPRSMIAIGLAGGFEDQGKRGRVIVATGAVQHDIDGRPLTQAKGVIPGLGISIIPANPAVAETLLRAARYKSEDAVSGLAAIAQVAHQNGLPWSALRVTSDSADETFDLKGVIGFGVETAANLFESIIHAVVDEL